MSQCPSSGGRRLPQRGTGLPAGKPSSKIAHGAIVPSRRPAWPRRCPTRFPPAETGYSLYEDVAYQEYWKNPLSRQDALEQYIISRMLPASGRRIIDLGCGYGRLAPCYVDRFDQVVLCDGSLSLLRDARAALGNRAFFVAADIARLPFRPPHSIAS